MSTLYACGICTSAARTCTHQRWQHNSYMPVGQHTRVVQSSSRQTLVDACPSPSRSVNLSPTNLCLELQVELARLTCHGQPLKNSCSPSNSAALICKLLMILMWCVFHKALRQCSLSRCLGMLASPRPGNISCCAGLMASTLLTLGGLRSMHAPGRPTNPAGRL